MTAGFSPPYPPRGPGPVAVWRGLFGERARTAVYGLSDQAFALKHIRRKVLGFTVHIPLDPDAIQRVLLDNAANYPKPDLLKKAQRPLIGRGLLSSDGQLWRDQRKIVAANFAPTAVDGLIPAFAQAARTAMNDWQSGTRDMAKQASATTMRIIADTLFGGDPRLTTEAGLAHIDAALTPSTELRLQALIGMPQIPLSLGGWRNRRGQNYLRRTLSEVIRDRMPDGGPDDFLGRLIRALSERFEAKEAEALAIDNAATFYLAGHETTANAITWTLFLLSEHPGLQSEVAAEADGALAGGTDDAGLPQRLPLLRRVLEESLRLYPPVPRFDRQAVADDRLGTQMVRAGDIVSIWPWLIHRHRLLWDDPDLFDPARFSEDRRKALHRFQYIPFGGGPRSCIGARLATVEALTVLAHWLTRWCFSPTEGRAVRLAGMITLRPANGLPLKLERR